VVTYWNGEAMGKTDYQDLDSTPEQVASTTATLAANTADLTWLLTAVLHPGAQAGVGSRWPPLRR
jgi:hypothetical protein